MSEDLETVYKTCLSCGNRFYIKPKDQQFFTSKSYELPKRCFECRKRRRSEREQGIMPQGNFENSED